MSGGTGPRLLVAHTLSAPPWRRIGAELATVRMLSYLAGEGWSPVVVPHSVRWPDGESARRIAPGVWAASPALAMSSTPALVYGHIPFTEKARRHAEQAGAPLVMAAHGGPPGWLASQVAQVAPDLVIANSETMAVGLRRTDIPVHMQHPPVFPEDTAQDVEAAHPWSRLRVTLVNASDEKGGMLVAGLARRLPGVLFLVVEGGYGEQVAALRSFPNVEVLEHGANMRAVWARTSLLLMPSREESWGMVAVEAMSAGVPVIGSAVPGLSECLGGAMPTLRPDDEIAWCAAIVDALADHERLHVAALRRAFELDPAPGLRSTHRRLAGLIGWDIPMSNLQYRNLSTEQVVDVEPGSALEWRLDGLPLNWVKITDTAPPTPVAGEQGASGDEPDADPSLTLPPPPAPPKASAKVADWQAYAIARGGDPAAVKAAPKGALVALYG